MRPSNFTFNHIGHFAAAGHAVAKAIFLGGVTRRFPDLRFGFLEGGSGWACQLFADLIEHWERRGKEGLEYMDPKKLDRPLLAQLVEKYGYKDIGDELRRRDGWPNPGDDELDGGVPVHDDYAACQITRKEDWLELYAKPFFFGCEPDDRMNAVAFSKLNPFGARINAIFSSDVGHFDIPDMRMVLPEAWELVEDELITRDDFRDFTFANAVRLFGTQNPDFFEGTPVAGRRRRSARQDARPRRRGVALSHSSQRRRPSQKAAVSPRLRHSFPFVAPLARVVLPCPQASRSVLNVIAFVAAFPVLCEWPSAFSNKPDLCTSEYLGYCR